MPNVLPPRFAALESKVEEFIVSRPQFKHSCEDIFNQVDLQGLGTVTVQQAAQVVDVFFDEVADSLSDFSIPVKKLTQAEVLELHRESSPSSTLTLEQFEAFYVKVLKFAAKNFLIGFKDRYGMAVLAGTAGVFVFKRVLRSVPVVGAVASPLLTVLLPTLIVGPILGCAVVYAKEHGGISSLGKLLPRRYNQFRSD